MSHYLVGWTLLIVGFITINITPAAVIDEKGVLHEALPLVAWSWMLMFGGAVLLLALFLRDRRKR